MLLQSETKIEPDLRLIAVLIKYILHLLVFDSFQGSIYVSEKLPTYPPPPPLFCPKWEVSVNVNLGEGLVGSFPET